MTTARATRILLALSVLWFASVPVTAAASRLQEAAAVETAMPFLTPGPHLGMTSYVGLTPDENDEFDERIEEAYAAGLDVARVMVDWDEVETEPGQFDLSALEDQLDRFDRPGTQIMLTLSVTDVDRYTLPADLQTDPVTLAQPIDDRVVIERYEALLDLVVPVVVERHDLFLLSVANEPNVLLAERPTRETDQLGGFLAGINASVDGRFPGIATSLTLAWPFSPFEAGIDLEPLVAPMDVLAVNWGCIDPATFDATGPESIAADLAQLQELSAGLEIVFQELSCASGWNDRVSGSAATPESQAAWFQGVFDVMAVDGSLRVAFVLDAIDWPDELTVLFGDPIRAEGFVELGNNYEEFLGTWGLFTYPDLQPKPAWTVFLRALESLSG